MLAHGIDGSPWLMLVDDDQISAMAVRRMMARLGRDLPLLHAIDGVDALDHLQMSGHPRPTVMLLDLYMPRMGGLDLLHCMAAMPGRDRISVFLMTSSDTPRHLCAGYENDITGFIYKDRDFDGLATALAQLEPATRALAG
ncbi:MAG: response regulator [Pseudomonadota bacterium]